MKISTENHRFQSDRRQIGGLLMLLGFCAIIQPSANIVSGFGPDGANETDPGEIGFWGLFGGLCLFINGVLAVIAGYMATVHDYGHPYLTQLLMITIQTAFIPYITDMTAVGKGARVPAENNTFIPLDYDPTDADVKFVGAMGILAILFYGFAFVGSMSFMVFSLHSYVTNKPEERSGDYFRGRLGFYAIVLALAGLVQAILGGYSAVQFESGSLTHGPVRAALLVVSYPIISILVGLIQFFNGSWALARSRGFHLGPTDCSFQISSLFQWVLVLSLQIVAQIGYLEGGTMAAAAPTIAAMSLGLNLMPAFLDHKMRTLPAQFPDDYYYAVINTSDASRSESATKQEQLDLEVPVETVDGDIDI